MQTTIHPTAIVDPSARLARGVVVGPFCLVGPNVEIGEGTELRERVHIDAGTQIGKHNRIFPGAILGTEPQDLKYGGERTFARIGDHNTIREYVTINRATGEGQATVVGNHNLLMAYCHVAHNSVVYDHVILANSVQLAGHIVIEDFAIVGGLVGVHQFVRIGCHAFVGGVSAVNTDILPYAKVTGVPCRPYGINSVGLRRRGFSEETIKNLKQAYRILHRRGLALDVALRTLEKQYAGVPEIQKIVEFVRESERGICR